jgi:uncharacterized protein YjbI with pentapeptide repeats
LRLGLRADTLTDFTAAEFTGTEFSGTDLTSANQELPTHA